MFSYYDEDEHQRRQIEWLREVQQRLRIREAQDRKVMRNLVKSAYEQGKDLFEPCELIELKPVFFRQFLN